MTIQEFHRVLDCALNYIERDAQSNPDDYNNCGGESFEPKVVTAVEYALEHLGLQADIEYTPGGHAFPDIVLKCSETTKYGIEVKSTKSNQWKINGNSVLGSTSDRNIVETCIFFGKLVRNAPEFRIRKYEECISDVAVTHSPRYKIDMELSVGDTFFDKSGIPYSEIKTSDNPIALVQNYYREQGSTAWWITETSPPILRLLSDLSKEEKRKFTSYGLAYFPEIMSTMQHKYRKFSLWLITEHSIIATNIRDYFSASGQVTLVFADHTYTAAPKIYKSLVDLKRDIISIIDSTPVDKLKNLWECEQQISDSLNDKMSCWLNMIKQNEMQNNNSVPIDNIGLVNHIFAEFS